MLRVGIVGTAFGESRMGMVGEGGRAKLVAIAGRNEEKTKALAARFGCDPVIGYEALVARDDVDVVGVYTSTDLHAGIAIAAARAGKHVIVTKPTTVAVAEGEALLAAARAAGVRLVVEFNTRYEPASYRIYRAIAEGRLGSLIQGDYKNMCLRGQAYYDEGNRWRALPEKGGGCLQNQGTHAIDHLVWYQGPVEGVVAMAGTFTHDIPAEDAASALVRFRNGSIATLSVTTTFPSGLAAGRYGGGGTLKRAQVHGSEGSAIVEGNAVVGWVVPEGEPKVAVPETPPATVFEDLALALADPSRPEHTLVADEHALETVYVAAALRRSAETGRYVAIDELKG